LKAIVSKRTLTMPDIDEKAAPTKTEIGKQFGVGDYADVGDPEKPSTWKLRLTDTPGQVDGTTIANAITALQPGGFRGNEVQLGSSKGAVVKKIAAAINKIEDPLEKKRLQDRLAKVKSVRELAEKSLLHGHAIDEKCEKCDHDMPSVMAPEAPYGGATSFGELEAWRTSSDLNSAIMNVAFDFRMLSDNVLNNADMDATEKGDALAKLSREFQDRVKAAGTMGAKDLEAELALLEEKAGRRMGKPQRNMLAAVMDNMKKLMSWASYDDGQADGADGGDGGDGPPKAKSLADLIPSGTRSGFKVFTDAKGLDRWLGYSTNAFEDFEGELFTTKALEEAITWHDAVGDAGPLRVFHVPGADIGTCDFQGLIGRMVVESGSFKDDELGRAAKAYLKAHPDMPFGMSIGFLFREGDERDGVYEWLRFRERSICPPGTAANPFTGFSIGGLPIMQLDERKSLFLKEMFGAEMAAGIIEDAERRTKQLEEANVRHKAAEDPDEAAAKGDAAAAAGDVSDPTDAAGAGDPTTSADGDLAEQIKTLVATMGGVKTALDEIAGIKTRLDGFDAALKALKASDDEKVAALMAPRSGPGTGARPSADPANVIDPDKAKAITGKTINDEKDPASPYVKDFLALAGLATATK
jgi:hypothetical protein